MRPTRRDFLKASAVTGAVGVNRLSASHTLQSEAKIMMPTERSKALMALFGLKYPIFEAPHGGGDQPQSGHRMREPEEF